MAQLVVFSSSERNGAQLFKNRERYAWPLLPQRVTFGGELPQSTSTSKISPPAAYAPGILIDPQPGYALPGCVRAALRAAKAMCDVGHALCLIGNHELNALYFHSKGTDGRWMRHHSEKNVRMHEGTLADFPP